MTISSLGLSKETKFENIDSGGQTGKDAEPWVDEHSEDGVFFWWMKKKNQAAFFNLTSYSLQFRFPKTSSSIYDWNVIQQPHVHIN